MVVCRTIFGQGWMLTGSGDGLQAEVCSWGEEVSAIRVGRITVVTQSNHRIAVNSVKLTYTQERDYYTMELNLLGDVQTVRVVKIAVGGDRSQQLSESPISI